MTFPKKCLSIDIGNNQIKIADVQRKGETIKVNDFLIMNTPPNSVSDGMIMDKGVLAEAINKGIRGNKIKTKDVVFTITSTKIITREVELPQMKKNKLKPIVEMNAGEYFPVNLSDYIIDFSIIDNIEKDGDKIAKVSVVAALTEMVEDYATVADLAGLKIAGIDYSGNSLANLARRENYEGTNIILDIGSDSTMVSIVENNVMKFNRNLLYGSSLIIDCIKSHYEVDEEEAFRISIERPLLDMDSNENPYLSNDITGAMNQILSGISRLIDYYTSRNNTEFRNIYIVGGATSLYGIQAYIEKYFNIDVQEIMEYNCVTYKGKKDLKSVQKYFINVFGACFSDINLMPKSIRMRTENREKTRILVLLLLLLLIPMILYTGFKIYDIQVLENRKTTIEADIAKAQVIETIKTEYNLVQEQVIFRESVLDQTKSTTEGFKGVIEAMEQAMPNEVFYLTMNNTETDITLNCVAKDKMTVAKFIETLKDLGYKNVYVPALAESGEEDNSSVSFTVTINYPESGEEGQNE